VSLQWDAGGVKVTVLSKVNGVTTPRGEFNAGESVVLAPGETGQIGRFTFVAEQQAAGAVRAAPVQADPFQGFAPPSGNPSSMFDDPFFLPTQQAPAPQIDTPSALAAMSGKPAPGAASFSGASTNPQNDPLAAFGGNQPPVHSSVSIDEFLGAPGGGSGLGAASLLKPEAPAAARRLATDHVHDFNLPVQTSQFQPAAPQPAPAADLDALAAWGAPPASAPAQPVASAAPAAAPGEADPWSAFAKEWVPDADPKKAAPFPQPANFNRALDDAFSSSTAWRVEDMPGADPLSGGSFESEQALGVAFSMPGAASPAPSHAPAQPYVPAGAGDSAAGMEAALRALCRGLGITGPPHLKEKDWEQLGRSIRQIVQGMSDLMNVRAELKKEMRAVDRTMLGAQENNPLKSGMPIDELLHYVLFMTQGVAGYMPVQRALEESIDDLRAHEFASLAAVRAVVEGSIREFDPAKLRTSLLKGKRSIAGMLDNARLWDLYTTHYEHRGEHMADWLEQVFSRHFMPAYTREAERLRREAQAQRPQPATPPNT
jgi:type VI secretion system FHA domain protein